MFKKFFCLQRLSYSFIFFRIVDGTAASSEKHVINVYGEVSFNGLGKDEVMKYADEPFWKRLRWVLFILFWVGWFAMLVTAVIIIAMAPRCPPRPDLKWYQKETVYQVLPESFKDSNEDGHGDFDGKKNHLPAALFFKLIAMVPLCCRHTLFGSIFRYRILSCTNHFTLLPKSYNMYDVLNLVNK